MGPAPVDDLGATIEDSDGGPTPSPTTIGRYLVSSRLGAGAMGVVWLATDPQLERKVAIKVVHPHLASSADASRRMLREARAMAKLSHRGVVTVYDAGEADGRLFIAMELIPGETLTERLGRPDLAKPSAWQERLELVLQAGRGLAAAHAGGVLHRDFKPDNVLVDAADRACVSDFGLATLGTHDRVELATNRVRASFANLTTTGAILGTPYYMSPQQLRGEPADAFGDQFAFCVAAYEALYGIRPFAVQERGLDALPALVEAIEAGIVQTSPQPSAVPSAVRNVLERGMHARSEQRWPDVQAVLVALENASGLRARRRRRLAIAVTLIVSVVLAASMGAYIYARALPTRFVKRSLFRVPIEASIALSEDGKTIAVGLDRIEIHVPDQNSQIYAPLASSTDRVLGLALGRDSVTYSTFGFGQRTVWQFQEKNSSSTSNTQPSLGRMWLADFGEGWLAIDGRGRDVHYLLYIRAGEIAQQWPITYNEVRTLTPSPNREKFAYIDSESDQIVVVDLRSNQYRSTVPNPTAVAWTDEDTLVYARGTQISPTINQVALGKNGFGIAHELYHQDTGWFMRIIARGGRLVFVDASPVSRVRLEQSGADAVASTRDYDPSQVAAELGWTPNGELLTWSRTTSRVSRGPAGGLYVETQILLPREPLNATISDDVLIATTRSETGRDIDAYSLSSGAHLWKAGSGLQTVRCTDDRRSPCVAIRRGDDHDDVLEIDSSTGATGRVIARTPKLADITLRGDGRVTAATVQNTIIELASDGSVQGTSVLPFATVRSIAFDPDGRLLVAGTAPIYGYAVGRFRDGIYQPVMTTDAELLLLPRASPDGTTVAVIGRSFSADLAELVKISN